MRKCSANIAPIEPIKLPEEIFDANNDSDIFDIDYDYSNWENAQYIDFPNAKIKKNCDGLLSLATHMPEGIISVTSFKNPTANGVRIFAPYHIENVMTKSSYELYAGVVSVKKAFNAKITKTGWMWINTKPVNDVIEFTEGDNFILWQFNGVQSNPQWMIFTDEEITFKETTLNSEKSVWWMYDLASNHKYYAWSYTSDIFAETNTPPNS